MALISESRPPAGPPTSSQVLILILLLILIAAAGLRTWKLGALSFWYDEVVTMRLAQAPTPATLLDRLSQIDATRAPLHPLLLHGWIRLFGSSEAASRSFSVVCGVLTVVLIWWIGCLAFDPMTGLYAGWLAALSPLLVYYSRETRMYALLVLLTCLCWGLLFSFRRSPHWSRKAAYSLCVAALIYAHPLGLVMAGTLGLAALTLRRAGLGWRGWLVTHAAALLIAAPWIGRYLDHSPEFVSGRLPIKFLLGTPIGFIGGNFVLLACLAALIAFGLIRRQGLPSLADWTGPAALVLWLVLTPTLLYAYSWIGSPVFGPARYTLFVAPAYLILIAQGLARLPILSRSIALVGLTLLEIQALRPTVYAPDLKADWRACAAAAAVRMATKPAQSVTFVVMPPGPGENHEVETARYYLPETCRVIPWREDLPGETFSPKVGEIVYLSMSVGREPSRTRSPSGPTRHFIAGAGLAQYPGLAVYSRSWVPPRPRPFPREPAVPAR
jgi:hypothetical protein